MLPDGPAPCSFVGHGQLLNPLFLGLRLVVGTEEARVSRHQPGKPVQQILVSLDRGQQQLRIYRPLLKDFVIGNDLMLRFLDLDHLAKLGRLGRFALANGLGVLFKQAQHFVLEMRVAFEHPGSGANESPGAARVLRSPTLPFDIKC